MTGVLRREMGFDGIVYTDSMGMAGVTALYKPGDAAVRAIKAGNDIVLHSPDDGAAFAGIKAAVQSGEIPAAQLDTSVERILRAKARTGLHRVRAVNLDALAERRRRPRAPGGRGRGEPEVDHAGAGSAEPGAAEAGARRAGPLSLDSRHAGRMADRGARAARSFPS